MCIYIGKIFLYKEGNTIHLHIFILFFTCLLTGEGVKQGQLPRGQVTQGQGGGEGLPLSSKKTTEFKNIQ